MTVQEIVRRSRSCIDELMVNDSSFLLSSEDEQNLTQVIIDKIGYALQRVMELAPQEKLDDGFVEELSQEEMAERFAITTDLVGMLKLPNDLLRIVEARLSSWSYYPLPESASEQTYLMQSDEWARGSWDRPVNILTWDGKDRILEMYCAKTASDTLLFSFVKKPDVSGISASDLSVDVAIPTQLEASLIYQVSGLAMLAFREDVAASLLAVSEKYLDIETK